MLKVIFFGDIVGKIGRSIIVDAIKHIKEHHKVDLIVANGENATHGFGISPSHFLHLKQYIDVITLGNHTWGHTPLIEYASNNSCEGLIKPINFPPQHPLDSYWTNGQILIINAVSDEVICHFTYENHIRSINKFIEKRPEKIILIDLHAESTAIKISTAYYFIDKVSAVLGTHTHVPTDDARILSNKLGFQTDVGMCGAINSIIGFKINPSMNRINKELKRMHFEPSEEKGEAIANFVEMEFDTNTGYCTYIKRNSFRKNYEILQNC